MYSLNEKALIFIDGILNLEYKHKRSIIDLYNEPCELFKNPQIALDYLKENFKNSIANSFNIALNENFTEKLIDKYNGRNIVVVTEISNSYPNSLYNLPIRPICLYTIGNVKLLNSEKLFSIVGSRKTIPEYLKLTEEFSCSLSKSNVTIVTGVADGGDLSAIKGSYKSGNLILVLAGGLDFIDNEPNRNLIRETIDNNGLVITEYPPEIPPRAYHYPVRNRIIAGLSLGTLIVSGNNKSGARHTASFALDYGKEVFAFPYNLSNNSGELCNNLIKDGAYLVTNINDICDILGFESVNNAKLSLTDNELNVYLKIKEGIMLFDDLLSVTNLKVFELMSILTS